MNSKDKIHEFVKMARHPEAKDLAEALNKESKITGCLIEDIESPLAPQYRKIVRATILWNELDSVGNERYYCYKNNHTYTVVKKQVKILGRPITAFDVCWALNKNKDIDGCYKLTVCKNNVRIEHFMGTDIMLCDIADKTLDEWGDEVCDKIGKLIKL